MFAPEIENKANIKSRHLVDAAKALCPQLNILEMKIKQVSLSHMNKLNILHKLHPYK